MTAQPPNWGCANGRLNMPRYEVPPDFEGLSNEEAIDLAGAFIRRYIELVLEQLERDLANLDKLELYDQLVLRARWWKYIDLLISAGEAMNKYDALAGELDLIAQTYGDQLGLPAQSLSADIANRLEWYKNRIAKDYERAVKRGINLHTITSAIEQIFLMEWRYLRVDERYGVKIRPQKSETIEGTTYTIDFVVASPDQKLKLAIELDGHDFHEKTKQQATRDRARERKIVRQGYPLFRFTGSEVVENPRKCVEEVVDFLSGRGRGES